ncbi:hypothetical protein AB376_09875 [Listeria monocytogenes]|nr:hypothetical protein [Listeria monocytogenes]
MVLKKNIHRKNNFPSEEKGILNAQFPRKLKNLPESIFFKQFEKYFMEKKESTFFVYTIKK